MTRATRGFHSPGLSEFVRTVLISGAPSAIVQRLEEGRCYVGVVVGVREVKVGLDVSRVVCMQKQ